MDIASAYAHRHGLRGRLPYLALAVLVAALVLIAVSAAVVAVGAGHDAQPLLAPFRWQPWELDFA
jgi:hypothetical protein